MFSNYASRWDFDTIMDCVLRFLQFDVTTLFCRPFKCEAIEEETCFIETSDKDEKEEIGKPKIAKRNMNAPRKRYERKTRYALDANNNNTITIPDDAGDGKCKEYESGELLYLIIKNFVRNDKSNITPITLEILRSTFKEPYHFCYTTTTPTTINILQESHL
uniref:Uncharacterized protein n=1 Tax=Glossina brevipalpis TaxID=37001 RepID=A0A1A9W518_9MUSC